MRAKSESTSKNIESGEPRGSDFRGLFQQRDILDNLAQRMDRLREVSPAEGARDDGGNRPETGADGGPRC
jgi:hypothetical protein